MRARAACLAAFAGWLLCAAPAAAAVFHPESYLLANGLRVIVVPNALSDATLQMLWIKAGAMDDPQAQTGSAHYLEHLMFKGTKAVPEGAFSARIAALGGQDNAFTTQDSTAFYTLVSRENLPEAMRLEADRLRGLTLDPVSAAKELDVVRSERQERTDNKPQGLFEEKMRAALFGAHPYGRPVIGWPQDLADLSVQTARAFYERNYRPDNAILVLSGNIEGREALALAAATFGRLPAQGALSRPASPPLAVPQEKTVVMYDARVRQPYWSWRMIAPSAFKDPHRSAALEVLAETLTGGEVGLLYRRFVIEKRMADALEAGYDGTTRGPSVFSVTGLPAASVSAQELAKAVEKELRSLARKGVPRGEIIKAKKRLQDAALFARDRLMTPAQVLGETLAAGGSLADVEDWPARIGAVQKADIDAALRELLATPFAIQGFLLPKETE